MMLTVPHISICVCTYRRQELLKRLLTGINRQESGDCFTYSIVVADNDAEQTARSVVAEFLGQARVPVVYCVEPRRNIALVRNRAIAHADGDFIALIDDDESPASGWLLNLFKTCTQPGVAGVLGPVVPHFDTEPPKWVRTGGFYERPRHPTGHKLEWTQCRTGNVLFAKRVLSGLAEPFRAEFGSGGEDQDFFRRAIELGNTFVWCDEAPVSEVVPPSRWRRRFMLRRALLRGRNFIRHHESPAGWALKSAVAALIYALMLPVLFVMGHHHFMRYLVKLADHTGRLLAVLGLNPMRERPM